jgi:hypothetical protein
MLYLNKVLSKISLYLNALFVHNLHGNFRANVPVFWERQYCSWNDCGTKVPMLIVLL